MRWFVIYNPKTRVWTSPTSQFRERPDAELWVNHPGDIAILARLSLWRADKPNKQYEFERDTLPEGVI